MTDKEVFEKFIGCEINKIVDKIVEETPLLCMSDDKQMQRDFLKEKWTNWFKKEYNL